MYLLGVVCALCTLPDTKGATLYDHLFLELFLDLYVLCCILALIPLKVRRWIRGFLYAVLYGTALADVYCFVDFGSTLNPSMLMLVGETDSREAGEFLSTLVSPDVIFSKVGWILLLMLVHITYACRRWLSRIIPALGRLRTGRLRQDLGMFAPRTEPVLGVAVVAMLIWSGMACAHNKAATWKLMSGHTIGEVEHTLTDKDHAELYTPISRLVFSVYANELASRQIGQLIEAAGRVSVDSCSFRSPNIVLIIGESYAKNHSQQYGYFMPTTPRQIRRERSGLLVKYDDVVTCWNLTSFVFKNVFSLHVVGEKGEWCDYPLFPEVFRKAGYHVTFLTNQFLPEAKEAVYDFSGGFFLNNPQLSRDQFDTRNTSLHVFDSGLLDDYDQYLKERKFSFDPHHPNRLSGNLFIFHLIGQHVNYRTRCPRSQFHFMASDYDEKRPDLSPRQRKVLSYYDNAVLYNDSIVDQIIRRFEHQNAIVIYMPDHGEECYEGNRGFICRNHSAAIDWPLAHYEFEVPFWIYCSRTYVQKNPEIFREIIEARHRKFMTDALPHLLLYLAGIQTKDYRSAYNLLSPDYDENRPRILKNTTDYDQLRPKDQQRD